MAFEALLETPRLRPFRFRRLTYVVSLIAHGAALVAAVTYSLWRVDELAPPAVTVTFVSGTHMPAPPPPPPPAAAEGSGDGATPKRKVAPRVRPQPVTKAELLQPKPEEKDKPAPVEPRETSPPEEPKPAATSTTSPTGGATSGSGQIGGVAGGSRGGVSGGVVGGVGAAPVPVAAKVLPPHLGQLQKLSAPEPLFPVSLRSAGVTYHVLVRITVAPSGSVDNVALLKRAHPDLDASVLTTVRTWRHRPLLVNGTPVPFSYIQPFQFTAD